MAPRITLVTEGARLLAKYGTTVPTGKERYQRIAEAIVVEAGLRRVVYVDRAIRAYYDSAQECIVTSTPTTAKRVLSVAHECGHHYLGHAHSVPRHRKEFEAVRYAVATLRRHGLTVKPNQVEAGQRYVLHKMRQSRAQLTKVDRESWEWCLPVLNGILSGKLSGHGWQPAFQQLASKVESGDIQLVNLGRPDPTQPPPPRPHVHRVRYYDSTDWKARKSTTRRSEVHDNHGGSRTSPR